MQKVFNNSSSLAHKAASIIQILSGLMLSERICIFTINLEYNNFGDHLS